MQEQIVTYGPEIEGLLHEQHPRLVSLCAYFTGNLDAAEDLAQETLIEAWRNQSKLVDPSGALAWLSAVARNVCRRYLRRQGRLEQRIVELGSDTGPDAPASLDETLSDDFNLEIELERDELAGLLDRALAQLPEATRTSLVQRYVMELPQIEIAARLGVSEGAVEARLQRGKLLLQRLLKTDLRLEAEAFGLITSASDAWQETRLWCPICGKHKLYGQLPGQDQPFELHCPHCAWEEHTFIAQSTHMEHTFAGVKGYRAILRRFSTYMYNYLLPGLQGEPIACHTCRRPLRLRHALPEYMRGYPGMSGKGVSLHCPHCGSTSCCDIYGLALDTPEGQAFWRQNPRLRTLPESALEYAGRPALQVRLESLTGAAALDVILDAEMYRVLAVYHDRR